MLTYVRSGKTRRKIIFQQRVYQSPEPGSGVLPKQDAALLLSVNLSLVIAGLHIV
jgi:hypothetical protein